MHVILDVSFRFLYNYYEGKIQPGPTLDTFQKSEIPSQEQSFKTRPGPRLGFRVLAGSPGLTGSAGSILKKKNQNDVVLVKKKQKSTGLSPRLDRVSRVNGSTRRVTPSFSFFLFFVNPARFRSRVDPPGRVSKLWSGDITGTTCPQAMILDQSVEPPNLSFLFLS